MAIIYSYPQVKPKASDLLIGTVTYDATGENPVDGNPTRTFSVQDVANLVASYELSTTQNGTNATLRLTNDIGNLSVVNLVKGNGITLTSNGSNAITIANSGLVSVNATDTNYIDTNASVASGVLNISSSLSATGSATSSSFLRGDNKWVVPVNSISAASSTFINVGPSTTSTGSVIITAALSATGTPTSSNFLRGDNQWAVPAGGGTVTSVNSGTGISVDNTDPDNPIINNTGVLSNIAGTGISISNATGNSTITNIAPDQTVVITGSGDTTVTGTYPNFDVSSDSGVKSIIAGSNVTLSPVDGLGNVTVNAVAGGGIMAGWNLELTSPDFAPVYSTITNDYNVKISSGSSEIVMGMLVNDPVYNGTWASWDLDLSRTGASLGVQSASDFIMFARPELSGNPELLNGQYKVLPSNISLSAFGAPTTDLSIGTNKLTNVVNPTDAQDAATKNYVDNAVVGGLIYQGAYDASTNTPVLDSRGTQIAVTKGWTYTVTVDGTFYGETVRVGDVLIAETDLAAGTGALTDWTTVQSNIDLATAGTDATAVRGLAGFDTDNFTVANGFVNLKVGDIIPTNIVESVVAGTNVTVDNTDPKNPIVSAVQATVTDSNFVFIDVKNETGVEIPLGTGCMAVGTDGNSGHILVAPMIADGSVEPKYYIGVLEETIQNGEFGRVVTQGEVNQINTNAFLDGDVLWCDPANPGGFTKTEPLAPNLKISTAIVLNSSTNGKIFVRVQGNEGLHELHDVGIVSQTDKQVLAWNDTAGYWQNQDNLYSLTAGTGLDGGTITTTGTISLANTAVTPGAYTNANITVDQQGRITLASNGDPGGVTSFTASNGTFITLTPNTTQSGAATLTADLSASGTADSTTFLRGDNQWVTVAGTTYDYSSAQSGSDVNLNLIPSTGTTDTVKLVAGSGVTITDDGSNNVTIAASSSSSIAKDDFVGDGTTQAFTLSVTPFSTLFTSVYIAGVYQEKETYSITDSTLTFTTAPPDTASIEVMSVVVSNITPGANTITRNDFVGTGTQTDYTLSVAPSSINFVDVYVSGAYQNKDGFSIIGTTLSFSEAPANNDEIEVIIISNVSLVQNEQINYSTSVISSSTTAVKNTVYVLTADLTLTLPLAPQAGDSIKISNLSGVATCILGRNGSLIMGVASDLTLDTPSASFELVYSGATKGWVIIGL